jgi:hypothetical protein
LNWKPSESFTNHKTSDPSQQVNVSSFRSTTPNFRSGQESPFITPTKKNRWVQSAPRLNLSTCNESIFNTPVHSPQPSSMPYTIRKRARRIASIWPPKDNEDEISSPSPSPSLFHNKNLVDDDITNLLDDSRYNQVSFFIVFYVQSLTSY